MVEWISRVMVSFLNSGLGPDEEAEFLRRVRTLNLTGLAMLTFGAIYLTAAVFLQNWVVLFALGALFSGGVVSLVVLRRTLRVSLVAHLLLGFSLVAVFLANWYTGGLVWSNDVTFLIVPVMAVYLVGWQGLIWVTLTLVGMSTFWLLHGTGYAFPQVVAPEDQHLDSVFTWLATLIVLVGVTLFYETARRRTAQRILLEKQRAEAASQAKNTFLASMSHEFRTPLNSVIGLTDVTMQSDLSADNRRHLLAVKASAYALLGLVEDALDITRLEAGRLDLHPGPFNPRAMLQILAAHFETRAREKGLAFHLEIGDDIPEVVRGDAARVRQVIAKVVDNAIKFTDQGGVRVLLDHRESGWLTYTFQDTGIGIGSELRDRIFDNFSQGDESVARKHTGSGLGLAICHDLVELMGGHMEYQSMTGLGTSFEVWLPLTALVRAHPSGQPTRILAVEDDPLGRELVTTILTQAGHRVDVAANGLSAVEAVGRVDYDLILMDVQMPQVDGLEATRRIRHSEAPDHRTPILALTAHALTEERERCFEAGMDDFITKPVEPDSLLQVIARWLGQAADPENDRNIRP